MRQRLPILLSATALLVAVFGSTPLGHAAGRVIHAVPPFAKTAGYAKFAGNASQLNGRKSTLSGAPGTIPVVGRNGKLPASIGAVGPQGAAGLRGPAGPAGPRGTAGAPGEPGLSGYEIVRMVNTVTTANFNDFTVTCPAGKKALGWGYSSGAYSPADGPFPQHSVPTANGDGWAITAARFPAATWTGVFYAICATVES